MDELEKKERERQSIMLKFKPFLPCVVQDCLNPATVGEVHYDPVENVWLLSPMCKECTFKTMNMYGVEPGEPPLQG